MTPQRRKKAIEYHFVDMNDPDRYKKLKVARACDFCRKRKSKCDVGIPNSGTCSNCKKSNQTCIFSQVSPSPSLKSEQSSVSPSRQTPPSDNRSFTTIYNEKYPFLSINSKAHCGYEKDNVYVHVVLGSTPSFNKEVTMYSERFQKELFDSYFTHIHPFFPVLDKYYISQSQRLMSDTIPESLKWAIMAIALSHSTHTQDASTIAELYYQNAVSRLDHTPCLLTVQTLLLLYKYQEIVTPVGTPFTVATIDHLKKAQSILVQLTRVNQQKEDAWTVTDEFICRAGWILFIILSMSNMADERWKTMHNYCTTPSRLPSLTDSEQYDKNELNTTCNLIHLINIALLYSQAICLISDQGTLFSKSQVHLEEFNKLEAGLATWTTTLPTHITTFLNSSQRPYATPSPTQNANPTSFTNYLCLIYDILHLLISVHQPIHHRDMPRDALSVCIRAFNFTIGDLQTPQLSRLASIQGSRIVSFGLTLALQVHAFHQCQFPQRTIKDINKYNSSCSLSFQIFDQMSLSPQLYMTIQTYRSKTESDKQSQLQNEPEQRPLFLSQQMNSHNSNNGDSTRSVNQGLDSSTSSSNSSSYSIHTPNGPNLNSMDNATYYFHQNPNNSQSGETTSWSQYSYANNVTHNSPHYSSSSPPPSSQNKDETFYQLHDNMPTTPTLHHEKETPFINVSSYFQPQVLTQSFTVIDTDRCMEFLYDAKGCRNNKRV